MDARYVCLLTWILTRRLQLFVFIVGWITWFAWISLLAGVANTTANMIQGLAIVNYPDYVPERWHLTLIIFAMLIFEALMNMYAFWLIPWVELLAGMLHILLFVVFVVVLAALAPRHTADYVFLNTQSASGWTNSFVSWNIGLITPTWGFVGECITKSVLSLPTLIDFLLRRF
jgi:choline transport protein